MPAPLLLALPAILKAAPKLVDAGVRIASKLQGKEAGTGTAVPAPAPGRGAPRRARGGRPAFDVEQRTSIAVISTEVERAALPAALAASRPALTLALVVNAYAESRLRPRAHNPDGEDSVGLFQVNRAGGLGRGMSRQALMDPRVNTQVILAETARLGARFDELLRAGATVPQLTAAITLWVERPANTERRAVERAQMLADWFPHLVQTPALRWVA